MSDDAVAEFLGRERSGALCLEGPGGELCGVPVRVVSATDGELHMVAADAVLTKGSSQPGRRGCVVADEFESYEGIKGVIVQGELREDDVEVPVTVLVMEVTRAMGFSFAGTLPPHLAES